MRIVMRSLAATGVLVLSLGLTAACGDSDDPTVAATGGAGTAFPVTVTHKLGSTTVKAYGKLSKLAPTLAYQTGPAEDTWQQITQQVAKALGRTADGAALIASVEKKIASVQTTYPQLKGKGFALTSVFPSGNIGVMKSPDDTTVKLLEQFGMTLPEQLKKLPGQSFAAELSMEKVSVLNVDVLLSHYNDDPATQQKFEGNKLFAGLPVVKRGSYVPLDLKSFWPLRTPTPLAVPYVVDQIVPQIAKAATAATPS